MPAISRRSLLAGCCGAAGAATAGWLGCGRFGRPLALDQPIEPTLAEHTHDLPAEAPHIDPRGWPRLFGPDLTSVSAETGLALDWGDAGPPELWRRTVGGGYSSPVVVGDDLILLHRSGDRELLSCFSPLPGDPKWEHGWPTSFRCKFEYSNGPYGTPLIDGERVYAAGAEGRLVCVQRTDGSLVWQRLLGEEMELGSGLFGFGPGLATDDQRLYLNAGGSQAEAGIVALDKLTGQTLWTATDHPMAYTTPRLATIHAHHLLLVLTEQGLVALDPATGGEHWTYPFRCKAVATINAVTPLVQDDLVVLMTGPGPGAVCLRIAPDGPPEQVWQDRRVLDSQFNTLVHHGGHMFGFSAMRQRGAALKCVEVATGKLRWEFPSQLDRGQALVADGRIILLGEHGHLATVDLDPHRLTKRAMTAQPLLAAPCYSAPALSAGRLYLRNETTLLCLSLR